MKALTQEILFVITLCCKKMSELLNRVINFFSRLRLNCLSPSERRPREDSANSTMHLRSQSMVRNDELFNAIHMGDTGRCQELLAMGVVNLQEGDSASFPAHEALKTTLPLQFAVMHRQPEIVRVLLRHGADPDWVDVEGKTALHTLVLYWPRCVPRDDPAMTSQEIAVYQSYLRAVDLICRDTLRRLCAFGGSPNARDNRQQSPLHYAARYDIPGAAEVLLSYGAYRDARDIDRMTPIMLAAAMGHDTLRVLLNAKPNVHLTCAHGKTALHHAVESRCPQHKKQACVAMLLREGADPNTSDRDGRTALHLACKAPDDTVISCLLLAGADADIRDANGMNALHMLLENLHSLPINIHTMLRLVDATLRYGSPDEARFPSFSLPRLEPLRRALLEDRSPPSLQRICRKALRGQLLAAFAVDKTQDPVEGRVDRLPLPTALQRFLVLDRANPVRQVVLGML